MKIVADTNIFLAAALDDPDKPRLVQITTGASILAPEILPYEVDNALSAMVKRGKLSREEALQAQALVSRISVRLVQVELGACLQLALDHNIYAYDAYFLQCARMLSIPLLTLDQRMQQVARKVGIQLLEAKP